MRETRISLPELALVAGTRVALGIGIGLLLADRFTREERRAVGWTLGLFGGLTTVPLALEVLGGGHLASSGHPENDRSSVWEDRKQVQLQSAVY